MLLLAIVDRETTTTTILVHHTSCTSVGYYVFYFLKRSLVSFRSIVGWPAKTKSNGAWIRHFLSSAYWHRVPELNIHIIINNIIVITCLVEQTATTLLRPVPEELRQEREGGREKASACQEVDAEQVVHNLQFKWARKSKVICTIYTSHGHVQ